MIQWFVYRIDRFQLRQKSSSIDGEGRNVFVDREKRELASFVRLSRLSATMLSENDVGARDHAAACISNRSLKSPTLRRRAAQASKKSEAKQTAHLKVLKGTG